MRTASADEEHASNRALRFGERDLLRLINRAADIVFRYRLSPPGYEFVSRAIIRVTGFTPEELYADPSSALKLVHRGDRALIHELMARGAGHMPLVIRWVRKDGSIVWVEQRTTSVLNHQREPIAIEGIAREIPDPTLRTQPYVRVMGDLRIDLDRGRVFVAGAPANLTPSEFRLLVLLADQPGQTVHRTTIMEALWNSAHIGSARSCEVHISKLRRKIERSAEAPRIETVRGEGYRLVPTTT